MLVLQTAVVIPCLDMFKPSSIGQSAVVATDDYESDGETLMSVSAEQLGSSPYHLDPVQDYLPPPPGPQLTLRDACPARVCHCLPPLPSHPSPTCPPSGRHAQY